MGQFSVTLCCPDCRVRIHEARVIASYFESQVLCYIFDPCLVEFLRAWVALLLLPVACRLLAAAAAGFRLLLLLLLPAAAAAAAASSAEQTFFMPASPSGFSDAHVTTHAEATCPQVCVF